MRRAGAALNEGNLPLAEQYLGLLAQVAPHDAEYLRRQALVYDARGWTRKAVLTMRRVMALGQRSAVCCDTMARLLDHAYEYDEAVSYARRAVQLDPNFFIGWYNLSIVLTHVGSYDDAVAALRRASKLDPANPLVRTKLAELLRDQGQFGEAEKAYREILRERPVTGAAWLGLADLKTLQFCTSDIEEMRLAIASPRATPDDRAAIGYSLAKAYEDAGQFADSLKALAAAKAILMRRRTWDAKGFSRTVNAIIDTFTSGPVREDEARLGREVIFIVGLPRSGTTLVEQILASHPEVEGGGEITDLAGVLSEESARQGSAFPGWATSMKPADWARLGRRYLSRTACWRRRRPVHTDKLPSNWVFLGAIMAMLPAARIVCCRRDPLETCLSNYKQYRTQLEYTGSFRDLASFWHDYDRSVRIWKSRYPRTIFEHSYENLIAFPEASIRALLVNCGLTWNDRCGEFWLTQRDVHTPSAAQVRQTLSADTARSIRYGSLLDPLREQMNKYASQCARVDDA